MMDHNKVVRLSLKYLNIAFGVLMIVVLSLSLESIQHSRRLTNIHELVLLKNLKTTNAFDEKAAPDRVKVLQCQSCNNDALRIITIFNGKTGFCPLQSGLCPRHFSDQMIFDAF